MRLIDLDEAIKLLRGECVAKYPTTFLVGLFAAADELSKLPEVDAVPVVHGRWEVNKHNGFLCCSQCKDVYIDSDWLQDGKWRFCPNCGAKMDGGNEDAKN